MAETSTTSTPSTSPKSLLTFRETVSEFKFIPSPDGSSPVVRRSPRKRTVTEKMKYEPESDDDVLPTMSTPKSSRKRSDSFFESGNASRAASRSPKKQKRGYAPPEVYAHLNLLSDYLAEGLDVTFCGINPGYMSAETGHHFANPTNHFWKCLHRSGFTPTLLHPSKDFTLPEEFNLGLTNLVDRPSAEAVELSSEERALAVPSVLAKIARYKPRMFCFVGKGIWTDVERVLKKASTKPATSMLDSSAPPSPAANVSTPKRKGRAKKTPPPEFVYGVQPYKVVHDVKPDASNVRETLFFVVPSTSGRVVSHQLPDKVKLFTALKEVSEDVKRGAYDTLSMAIVNVPMLTS
ncbi:DNA glycosylase [Artomyces pyxidatus]|uniref:DNA glycosylase n=1 Tax=Artomyces pyxidatus TaxID=48021 RepID=A0ACB8T2T5_9AGAM|nr:DNA glycosylase [Artomyces pyxidatus]